MNPPPRHTTWQAPEPDPPLATKGAPGAPNVPSPIRLLNGRHVTCAGKSRWQIASAIAAEQRNRASRAQLRSAGFSDTMIHTALSRGEWRLEHRGVLILAADGRIELGREAGALLIAPGLALTGLSVLAALGLIPADPRRPVHVCCLRTHIRSRPGIRVHRYSDLAPNQIRIVKGLPMTTLERALLDGADEPGLDLERAVDEALAAHGPSRTSRTKLREVAAAATGRRGRAELLALADARRPSTQTKLAAAKLALQLIREAGLPEPETEVMLFGFPADFFYREAGVVLEVDSHSMHGLIRANFNRDRRRDRVHRQNGLEVVRVTHDELRDTPMVFVSDLSGALARRCAERRAA